MFMYTLSTVLRLLQRVLPMYSCGAFSY